MNFLWSSQVEFMMVVKDKAVLLKAQNLVISRRCFAEDSLENVPRSLYSTCKAICCL